MEIEPKNYLYKFNDGQADKYQLLVKKLRWISGTATNMDFGNTKNSIWVGYPFFNTYYTIFNYKKDTI